ncbi:glycerol-3-phosphate 1-O-acyltransferase PlsY [Tissierella creatinini]|nr:glycerol-3-phosphate 1-O-acyltransferase PlsY [Tissierella creatinini]TJX69224.1 glycerol-3-phosphate 1-O-acyltransferase PlsY [Soehngenia saccharolytica]
MEIFKIITLSYLLGCFSTAYLIGKIFKNIDIRGYGSGNAGATNVMRVLGKKMGVLTFLLDFVKGIIAVLIGIKISGYNGGLLAAIFVVLGHDYPVFLRFKGGKGISTTIGTVALLNFPIALTSVIIGILTALISKYVSLGSIIFLIMVPIISLIFSPTNSNNFIITYSILAIIGIYRHKENIKKILNKTENRMGGVKNE